MSSQNKYYWSPSIANPPKTPSSQIPRAGNIVMCEPREQESRMIQKSSKQINEKKQFAMVSETSEGHTTDNVTKSRRTVLDLLVGSNAGKQPCDIPYPMNATKNIIYGRDDYIKEVLQDYSNHVNQNGFWINPPEPSALARDNNAARRYAGEDLLDVFDIWNLCSRPSIFVWDPIKVFPELCISCPTCKSPAQRSRLCQPRILHRLHGNSVYVTVQYGCYSCGTFTDASGKKKRRMKYFKMDAPEIRASLPKYVSSIWSFMDTGKFICDAALVDLIRSFATKTSWTAIAIAVNEMINAAWAREI